MSKLIYLILIAATLSGCLSARDRAWGSYLKGVEQYQAGRYRDSLHSFEVSMRSGYHLPGIHADYAVALARTGRVQEAFYQLTAESRMNPKGQIIIKRLWDLMANTRSEPAAPTHANVRAGAEP